jgi:L-2-hydroxyglutarate oxidase
MESPVYDIAIVGGGIIGLATAKALSEMTSASIIVIEAEEKLAAHQTGNNSGVIHSGLYYKPGSLKAKNCVRGREMMYEFCKEYGIAHDGCGKVVVATDESEIERLNILEARGKENGLTGMKRISAEEIKEYEPHVAGVDGLWIAETGIVDYVGVSHKYAELAQEKGSVIQKQTSFKKLVKQDNQLILETNQNEIRARYLINAGGLHSDKVAIQCGLKPGVRIVPFRGEYYELTEEKQHLVKNLIYPVPDPRFPFLGVHFTRMVKGGIEAGPNAVLAFKRHGYRFSDISLSDMANYATYLGFWRMVWKYWPQGLGEMRRSLSKRAFVNALKKLIPEITINDVVPCGAGVRAQALLPNGQLHDDFFH